MLNHPPFAPPQKDWKTRSEGCEQLRELVRSMDDVTALLPHLPHFLVLLDTLIDDSNFRISMTVLDIYRLLVDKLQPSKLPAFLRPIVLSVMKHVGDAKVVVRIENMKVFRKVLQAAQPRLVVPILCDHLGHRASRIREDCLNLLIYALMTHPSYEFDLSYVAEKVGPTVADPKRRVRQAALECLAVIAQFLGPARLGPVMAAVDKAEVRRGSLLLLHAFLSLLARFLDFISSFLSSCLSLLDCLFSQTSRERHEARREVFFISFFLSCCLSPCLLGFLDHLLLPFFLSFSPCLLSFFLSSCLSLVA